MDKYEITVSTFDKLADKYQAKYMDFDFYFDTYDAFCDLVSERNAKVFEIACGPGNIAKYILKKHPDYQIHGIDLSPNMVALAKENNPTATFEVMDSRNMEAISEEFDAIICGFCTPYLSKADVMKLIIDMRAILKTGGTLYISTMEDEDNRSGFQTSSAGDQVYIHYHQFECLEHNLESNGFKIVNVQRKQFPLGNDKPTTDLFIYAKAI